MYFSLLTGPEVQLLLAERLQAPVGFDPVGAFEAEEEVAFAQPSLGWRRFKKDYKPQRWKA